MSSRVVICAPSWFERRALGGIPDLVVVRSGIGPRRSRRAAASAMLRDANAVAVVGIAGGLEPRLRTGDVVVADRVWAAAGPRREVALSAAALLADRLREDGLRVWLGPVASVDHVVAGPERAALRDRGAIAVDMESAWLLPDDRPGAVVRVIADDAQGPLLRPATLGRLSSATRLLPSLVPALRDWAATIGERRILLAEPRSFCAGVERAVEVVERALEQRGAPVYVHKQIVHNPHVVADLQNRGAVFVDELDQVPPGATVVFSAHGVSPHVRRDAGERTLDVIDATCPLVSKVHAIAADSDLVLVVGSMNSSNSLRLVETVRRLGVPAHLVDDADDIELRWLKGVARVGLTAGASAPQALVDEVVDALNGLGPVDIRTRNVVTEDIRFTLAKEVRSA